MLNRPLSLLLMSVALLAMTSQPMPSNVQNNVADYGASPDPEFSPIGSDQSPAHVDYCGIEDTAKGVPILVVVFHATAATVVAVKFAFWVIDAFGDRRDQYYGGITTGRFTAGAKIYPQKDSFWNRYYTRDVNSSNAVWLVSDFPASQGGSISCTVAEVKLADGTIWKDLRFADVSILPLNI